MVSNIFFFFFFFFFSLKPYVLEASPVNVFKGEDNMVGGEIPSIKLHIPGFFQAVFVVLLPWCSTVVMASREFTVQSDLGW